MVNKSKKLGFREQKENIRNNFNKYTRKAFQMLPVIEMPRILDIGCGSGVPTMELARLSKGEIIGLDTDQSVLDFLNDKIKKAKLSGRVKTINRSLENLGFPDHWFDIIWAEGSVYPIGFNNCIKEWKRFIKPGGYLVIHDEQGDIRKKIEQVSDCGYELLDYFLLDKHIWYKEYFAPLEKLVCEARIQHSNIPEIIRDIAIAEDEIGFYNNNDERNNSVFFIMRNGTEN